MYPSQNRECDISGGMHSPPLSSFFVHIYFWYFLDIKEVHEIVPLLQTCCGVVLSYASTNEYYLSTTPDLLILIIVVSNPPLGKRSRSIFVEVSSKP